MDILRTVYWEEEVEVLRWYAVFVAPAQMQFLDVAGDVTVVRPPRLPVKPSLPAANTAVKSCTHTAAHFEKSIRISLPYKW